MFSRPVCLGERPGAGVKSQITELADRKTERGWKRFAHQATKAPLLLALVVCLARAGGRCRPPFPQPRIPLAGPNFGGGGHCAALPPIARAGPSATAKGPPMRNRIHRAAGVAEDVAPQSMDGSATRRAQRGGGGGHFSPSQRTSCVMRHIQWTSSDSTASKSLREGVQSCAPHNRVVVTVAGRWRTLFSREVSGHELPIPPTTTAPIPASGAQPWRPCRTWRRRRGRRLAAQPRSVPRKDWPPQDWRHLPIVSTDLGEEQRSSSAGAAS